MSYTPTVYEEKFIVRVISWWSEDELNDLLRDIKRSIKDTKAILNGKKFEQYYKYFIARIEEELSRRRLVAHLLENMKDIY
jgi:hypothetical protein